MEDGRSLVAFLLFISIVIGGGVAVEYIATGNENHTFPSRMTAKLENIEWKHNGDLVVDWDPANKVTWYRYKERAELDINTGDLTLRQLKPEDSGVFKGQFQVAGFLQYTEYTIKVIDKVSKPTVTCEKNDTGTFLTCKVDPPVQAKFSWQGPNGFTDGPKVQINNNKEKPAIYFCTASNEVSNAVREFHADQCFEDVPPPNPGTTIAIAICIVLMILAAIIAALVISWKKKVFIFADSSRGTRDTGKCVQTTPNDQNADVPNDESLALKESG